MTCSHVTRHSSSECDCSFSRTRSSSGGHVWEFVWCRRGKLVLPSSLEAQRRESAGLETILCYKVYLQENCGPLWPPTAPMHSAGAWRVSRYMVRKGTTGSGLVFHSTPLPHPRLRSISTDSSKRLHQSHCTWITEATCNPGAMHLHLDYRGHLPGSRWTCACMPHYEPFLMILHLAMRLESERAVAAEPRAAEVEVPQGGQAG